MWVSLLQKWSLGIPVLVALYAALLSAVTPWLWYRFLREYLRSGPLAELGWAMLAWLPSWICIYRYVMTETLFLPLLGLSLWQTVRARRRGTASSFGGMVFCWTLAGMTRGIALPLAGLAGAWVWWRQPRKVRRAALALVIASAMALPIAIRNHHLLHLWSPFGTGWPNQIYAASGAHDMHLRLSRDGESWYYEFGSPSLYFDQLAPLSKWQPKRSGVVTITADLTKGDSDWAKSYRENAAPLRTALRLRWENVVLVMLGESWPDNNRDCRVALAALSMRWLWAPVFVLMIVMGAVWRRVTLARPLLPVLIGAWFVFQAASLVAVNEGRYRKPLEGLLICQLLVWMDSTRFSARWLVER
jgi:hypothetical protein